MLCLTVPTDDAWVKAAILDLDHVLVDHAHCEMKAASNALSLAARNPDDMELVRSLVSLAREEIDHFERVAEFLSRRGLSLGKPIVDEYAARLRKAADHGDLVDRLLTGALIEARSCERFKLLLDAFPREISDEMRVFYNDLFAAEARHFRVYVDLAKRAGASSSMTEADVNARLSVLAAREGDIVRALAAGDAGTRATIHG